MLRISELEHELSSVKIEQLYRKYKDNNDWILEKGHQPSESKYISDGMYDSKTNLLQKMK